MNKSSNRALIPKRTVYRLSVYLRCVQQLRQEGVETVSSQALANAAGVKPTQLRKDLTCFGQFGTRGLGYDVKDLCASIADNLGTNRFQPVILVGVGNLGSALLEYKGFEQAGFEIVGAFDIDTRRRRSQVRQPILPIEKLAETVRQHKVRMAILSVPSQSAQEAAQAVIEAGIVAILNFAPTVIHVPAHVRVNNVNLASELENLSYFVQKER